MFFVIIVYLWISSKPIEMYRSQYELEQARSDGYTQYEQAMATPQRNQSMQRVMGTFWDGLYL